MFLFASLTLILTFLTLLLQGLYAAPVTTSTVALSLPCLYLYFYSGSFCNLPLTLPLQWLCLYPASISTSTVALYLPCIYLYLYSYSISPMPLTVSILSLTDPSVPLTLRLSLPWHHPCFSTNPTLPVHLSPAAQSAHLLPCRCPTSTL